MARDFLRMPKGVPREVARFIRTSTRKIPKAGQVLSYENAGKLYDLLTTFRRTLTRESRKALPKMEQARTRPTRQKYAKELATIRQKAEDTERAAAELERVELEDVAEEFEVGVDYLEREGFAHEQGWKSDVSFNARLYRHDGAPMAETEAREALAYFSEHGRMPQQIGIRWVSWTNAYGSSQSRKDPSNLKSFLNILGAVSSQAYTVEKFRMGSVKR